jgi:glucosylceramidase
MTTQLSTAGIERTGQVTWVVTTPHAPWRTQRGPVAGAGTAPPDVIVRTSETRQTIEGFGACFNELGWDALAALSESARSEVLRELFAPGVGASLTLCRMPIGANDFARDWYSYDEVDGDLALEHFSVDHDRETLIPFIRGALEHQPGLRLWASPWSPPTWMKTNKHYAGAPVPPWLPGVENGLRPEQAGAEGTDMFVLEQRYLQTYAAYFGRFVDEYREQGIAVEMVMPQNEFNSPQVFPSCTWTPHGLVQFLRHLGPEMEKRGVAVFLGTLERGEPGLIEAVLRDPVVSELVRGVGFQWGGKRAVAAVHSSHPELRIYQTEQECGDGRNDWRYCRYAWRQLKHYLDNGTSAYTYWNIALSEGGRSTWGWPQNSLVTVDPAANSFTYNHEYYLLKHVSGFVAPGARLLETLSLNGYENQLAFVNPDGSVVLVVHNDMAEEMPVGLMVDDRMIEVTLPADSFSTFLVPPGG